MTETDENQAVKPEHAVIWGDTGTGKTTIAREMQDRFDGVAIWVNHSYDGSDAMAAEKVKGRRVADYDAAKRALAHYDDWADVRLVFQNAEMDAQEICWHAMRIAREAPAPAQVVYDEADEVMGAEHGDATENAVKWGFRKGRSASVKTVAVSQTPVGMDWSAMKNSRWWCQVGAPSGLHQQFFDRHKWMPRPEELPDRDFSYAVYDKTGTIRYRGETDPNYA